LFDNLTAALPFLMAILVTNKSPFIIDKEPEVFVRQENGKTTFTNFSNLGFKKEIRRPHVVRDLRF